MRTVKSNAKAVHTYTKIWDIYKLKKKKKKKKKKKRYFQRNYQIMQFLLHPSNHIQFKKKPC